MASNQDKLRRNAIIGLVIGVALLLWGGTRVAGGDTFFGWLFVLMGIVNIVTGAMRFRASTGG